MRTTFLRLLVGLPVALVAALVTGCPGSKPAGSSPADVFVYARGNDAVRLDPQTVDDGESILICANLFEGLVRYGEGIDIVPSLATRWERTEGGLAWTFWLREGVTFHDGEAFDADAVVFTFGRLLDPEHPFASAEVKGSAFYKDITKVEKLGSHQVRFHLARPVAEGLFLGSLTIYNAFIIPPKAFTAAGPDRFASEPIGTGPYRLERWVRDQKINLDAFEGYWGTAPRTKRAVVVTVKENSSRLQQLLAGQIHAMDGLNPVDVDPLLKDQRLRVAREPGMAVGYLALNTEKPKLADPRVRRAIAHAIDRTKIVDLTFRGHARAAPQVTPESLLSGAGAVPPQDIEAAKKLLAAAGVEPGALSVELWAMPNPRPYMPEPKKVAELIKEDLGKVGIRCEIVTYPWAQYLEKTRLGEHDLCLLGWTVDVADADNILFTFFTEANKGGTNVSHFSDPQIEQWLADAQVLGDEAARRAIYQKVEARVVELAPMVPLVHPLQLAATRAEVHGLEVHPTGRRLFETVELR